VEGLAFTGLSFDAAFYMELVRAAVKVKRR